MEYYERKGGWNEEARKNRSSRRGRERRRKGKEKRSGAERSYKEWEENSERTTPNLRTSMVKNSQSRDGIKGAYSLRLPIQ
jgi:hypothetical protein